MRPAAWRSLDSDIQFGTGLLPGLTGYGHGLGQLGFDRAHAATPQAVQIGAFRAPVQFWRARGRMSWYRACSRCLRVAPALPEDPPPAATMADANPAAAEPTVEPAA